MLTLYMFGVWMPTFKNGIRLANANPQKRWNITFKSKPWITVMAKK